MCYDMSHAWKNTYSTKDTTVTYYYLYHTEGIMESMPGKQSINSRYSRYYDKYKPWKMAKK